MKKIAMGVAVLAVSALGACALDGVKLNASDKLTKSELLSLVSASSAYYTESSSVNGPVNAKITPDLKIDARDNLNGSTGSLAVDDAGRLCFKFDSGTWTSGCYGIYKTTEPNVHFREGRGKIIFTKR